MVALANIFNSILKKKDFKGAKDIDYLLEICKKFPGFDLPHIILLNYHPDIFNQEFWKKGEDLRNHYKFNLQNYFRTPVTSPNLEIAENIKQEKITVLDQKSILIEFLNKPKPKFI
jgi:hypothetical protein